MLATISCESNFRQFNDDGSVLTSKTDDVGIAQINMTTWGDKAKELGFDLYTTVGNLKMARYILDVQHENAWTCHKILDRKLLSEK